MITVFVIDDSLSVRNGFKEILSKLDDIELLGTAQNPVDALKIFADVGLPDLFILDIEMPKMDGLTFLKKINAQRPTPVIICSSLVGRGTQTLIDALRLGASDIIEKPKSNLNDLFLSYKEELLFKIRAIANANINYKNHLKLDMKPITKLFEKNIASSKLIAIGSSTGGIQVLEEVFTHLKGSHSGIIVVQHIPKSFSLSLALRLNELCANSFVKEAEDGDLVRDNTIYIAPGGVHIEVEKNALKYYLRLNDSPKVNSHRPSANVLFNSIANTAKTNAKGFIFTGMGDDGAKGLKNMKEKGAKTYVQNKKTSTVYGMPKVAWEMGSALEELSIYEIIKVINES
ncbi:chemotaxis-specific protein-glutamate methyltransferase CheB [Sulfurimonas sp. SAG-AH-194-C21]|nr:chemotaxis-specific protein-glutamate methyltransferase CheB [Sulfurimonas sp. SAG-AH-194-C21]MDF1884055.1 chemotaxis-specific protein-glutamate methyltransferase CheB [Sulfurimonas sp. SAG-AH-194-C21]